MNKRHASKVDTILSKYPHRTFKPKELARQLGIKGPKYTDFRDALKSLAAQGKIARYQGTKYGLIKQATVLEGELHVKAQGYGFLITEEGEEDVFISQKNMGTAFNKDLVKVQLFAVSKGRSREGRVVQVLKRAHQQFVGTYQKSKRYGFVIPDDPKMSRDIFIAEGDHLNAKSNQKVVVKIERWQDERLNPEGRVVEVLGYPDEPGVDVISVVKAFDLPTQFSAKVEKEAAAIPQSMALAELNRRLDLRNDICFTIDPEDAKDFDDAVSVRVLTNGNHELGVHIADVSFYVKEKSQLDKEALRRGTSVYLVDRVIPMLPEKLSNEICSLQPNQDRLTLSCIMEVSSEGKVVNCRIVESVIHSKHRFTYQEAQEIIDNQNSTSPFKTQVHQLFKLSQVLIKRRQSLGSLDLDLPEVRVELDEKGVPLEIKRQVRLDSHRLIEECMLLANQTVTERVAVNMRDKHRLPPFIYRIHEEPDERKMNDFRKFVRSVGYPLDPSKKVTAKLLGGFLDGLRGKPEEVVVEELLLRSLMKARYSTKNAGHFGLAFQYYTHFTSPIRRYPDLVVHRLLKEYGSDFDFERARSHKKKLEEIAKKASEREIVALEAERESIKMKKVEYMQRHLGDLFDGVISGVVSFGIFVEITGILVEGLVHISDLESDYYIHDEKNYQLVGQHTSQTYRLGDPVKVRVVKVNVDERVVDFVLADES